MKTRIMLVLIAVASTSQVFGVGSGGFTNQVVGTKALGMGNTFVATADDPSAVFFNPAGLTQLESSAISAGIAPHIYGTNYKDDTGVESNMEKQNPIVPHFYLSIPFLDHKLAFAIGIQSPFGLSTKWSDTGPLRYVATESNLQVLHVNPSLAYKVNDQLSLGAGVVFSRIGADLKSRLNQTALNTTLSGTLTLSPDGNKELKGNGSGWGYNFGVFYKPFEQHSFGASYRSQIMTRIKGKSDLSGLTGASAFVFGGDKYATDTETNLNLPQSLILGYAFKPGNWTFEADTEWVDYSSVQQTAFDFVGEGNSTRLSVLNVGDPTPRQWHSTWNFGVGSNYKINDSWQARMGYYYYPEVIPEHTWDPSVPDSARNGLTFGGSYSVASSLTIDLAYNLILFQKRTIHNSVGATSLAVVNGEYSTSSHIISLSLTYRFKS